MDLIPKHNIVHRYEKRKLLIAVNCVAGLAIFFFGYDQGMMGSVNVSIGKSAVITSSSQKLTNLQIMELTAWATVVSMMKMVRLLSTIPPFRVEL